jgi:hypothetical protein
MGQYYLLKMHEMNRNFNQQPGFTETANIAFLDLDGFGNCMEHMGWTRYSPNIITGFLTLEIQRLIRDYQAIHIWGMNTKEGTEEAILVFFQEIEPVIAIFKEIQENLMQITRTHNVPTSLSVGIANGKVFDFKPITHHRKSDFRKDPTRYLAYKALKRAKKLGGNQIVVY